MNLGRLRGFVRRSVRRLVFLVPALRRALEDQRRYRRTFRHVPPGHFYSPIPSSTELENDTERIFGPPRPAVPGVDLNEAKQLAMLEIIERYYADLPFPVKKSPPLRYYYENPYYLYSDAIFLYGMIRHAQPQRIVEVGSGFSSCVMLDTIELHMHGEVTCTFIDPYPERLESLLRPDERGSIAILKTRVQDVGLEPFMALDRNDILFIDSSHVVKVGSDVNYLLGEVLPRLQPGVYVHFHDIFYPFEYPKEWIDQGRYWNESYALKAFLAFNGSFDIILFNTYLEHFHRERFEQNMPLCLRNEGGSIWLQRTG